MARRFSSSIMREGRDLVDQKRVGGVVFSEGTYQVEVLSPAGEASLWPFLQIDEEGGILDSFCTCEAAEAGRECAHLAAALVQIYNRKNEPLHVRFRDSLWNLLCQIASDRHGYEASSLKADEPQGYLARSLSGRRLFQIRALTPLGAQKLEEIVVDRVKETEETSLKFSNLPPEEIALWREGRPSHHLCYELSFWSDLAKWWMLMQEAGEPYSIEFLYKTAPLPRWIQVEFPSVVFGFYLAEVDWPQIIPSLASVESPLFVEEAAAQRIETIHYDPAERCLLLTPSKKSCEARVESWPEGGMVVGEWIYVPQKGFLYGKADPCLEEERVPEEKIAAVLQKHTKLLQKRLVGTRISRDRMKPSYQLFFDSESTLHICPYLFEPGDLQRPYSALYGSWAYIHGHGFYNLENLLFDGTEKQIRKEGMSDFVNRHRHWLQAYEGFQTHVSSVEAHLDYQITPKGDALLLGSRFEIAEEGEEILNFGEWLFIKGRGFYAKVSARGAALYPGMRIAAADIPRFIHFYREELELIPHFFARSPPLKRLGVTIQLDGKQQIEVVPVHFYASGYTADRVRFFGDFTFVEGEGFHQIPFAFPEGYQQKRTIDRSMEPFFIGAELEQLRPYVLSIDPRLEKPAQLKLQCKKLRRDPKSKTGEWLAELEYVSELGSVPAAALWQALSEGKSTLFSPAGLLSLKQERFTWLKGMGKRRWLKQRMQLRLKTLEWLRLTIFEELTILPEDKESRRWMEELSHFESVIPFSLEGLKSALRAYQEKGVGWLWFLYTHGLSGLLCDEMGLGKTHQAMALLAASANAKGGKFLVVCPTSVIYHWEALLKRFLPQLRVRVFYGAQRSLKAFEAESDLLLTSYGTLRSERKSIAQQRFEIAVFDEIQNAKNVRSQTHKALRMVDAQMRLGLTGTPIENRLFELKALFDLILPGYLPSDPAFRTLFIRPIEREQDAEKRALLARLVRPFVLRRKKAEVLLELPEKTEEIAYCDLSHEQSVLYHRYLEQHREGLLDTLQDESKPIPYLHIFSLLTHLKQICNHPCLIEKNIENYKHHTSGKWELFVDLLQEARDSGQKLVVFSQYLQMLDIIKAYLGEQQIGFAEIRGSTRDRRGELKRFQEDPSCEVFIASLQAAGVGIELTAASVVIHYDRWWNPARENQATDRAHRMGQRRGVQVFKIVTKHTIEEHIHQLIESKMALMEGVIGFDEQDQIKGLDRAELIELLQLSLEPHRFE